MTSLPRLLRRFSVGYRAYSSFSSSKSGGGRFFNSAKPPKANVVSANSRKDDSPSTASTSSSTADGSDGTQHALNNTHNSSLTTRNSLLQPVDADTTDSSTSQAQTRFTHPLTHLPHPIINVKDFNLLQFFSLHRPLLLLPHPPLILQSAPVSGTIFAAPNKLSSEDPPPAPIVGLHGVILEENLGVSAEADIETARQLMRALTLHKAGGAVEWQNTLHRLGLDSEMNAAQRERMEQEWNEVMMDSTKRKRKKKMKKHKLKKRRRLTRASRLKIGR